MLLVRRRSRASDAAEIDAAARRALALTTQVEEPADVAAWAAKHRLSFYDASYLALTLDSGKGARPWTYDEALGKAAQAEGVRTRREDLDAL